MPKQKENKCKLHINITGNRPISFSDVFFKKVASRTFDLIGFDCKGDLEINLAFVGEKEMQKINKKWRGKNKPTDVLSFSDIETPQGKLVKKLGLAKASRKKKKTEFTEQTYNQILICLPHAKRDAKKIGLNFKQELAMIFSHGILHVLGYDHDRTKAEERLTYEIRDRIIQEFN